MDTKILILIVIFITIVMFAIINNYDTFAIPIKYAPSILPPDRKIPSGTNVTMSGPSNGISINIKSQPHDNKVTLLSAYNDDTSFEEDANFGNQRTEINKFIECNKDMFENVVPFSLDSSWTAQSAAMHAQKLNEKPAANITGI